MTKTGELLEDTSTRLPRRTLMHAAWLAPVIIATAASPALAASATPTITLSVPFNAGNFPYSQVYYIGSDSLGAVQSFALQAQDSFGGWQTQYAGLMTNSSGYWSGTLPRAVFGEYVEIRALASVDGYGDVASAPVATADIWPV